MRKTSKLGIFNFQPELKKIILVIIMLWIHSMDSKVYASAWLIDEGKYRYIFTSSNIDKNSRYVKQARADLRLKIEKQLEYLREKLKAANKFSAVYNKLFHHIKLLERTSVALTSYQDELTRIFAVEYGMSNNTNIGIQLLYKNNKLQGTQYISPTVSHKEISAFYKFKLFQNKNRIISVQPKISLSQYNGKQQFFYELSLLSGTSKKGRSISLFAESSFAFGQYFNTAKKSQNYYTISTKEGIKFNNGFMLVNFIKCYIRRKNYNYIYNKTIYNQFSIAKHIGFGNLKQKSFITQIGYFVDKSLVKQNYRVSGIIFSIWIDV